MKFEMTQNRNKKRKMLQALRGWRIGKRITQAHIASILGCCKSYVCQLEKGVYANVSFHTIQIYANAMGFLEDRFARERKMIHDAHQKH